MSLLLLVALCAASPPARAQENQLPMTYDDFYAIGRDYQYRQKSIALKDFRAKMKEPGVVILDLRDQEAYDHGHIPGALFLGPHPTDAEIKQAIPTRDSTILMYNANSLAPTHMINTADLVAPQLAAGGYKNASMLEPIWRGNPGYQKDLISLMAVSEENSSGQTEASDKPLIPMNTGEQAWADCLGDEDCVIVEQICLGWIAINKKYGKDHEKMLNSMRPMVECAQPDYSKIAPAKAVCVEQRCVIKD